MAIQLTDRAADRVREFLAREGKGLGLRVGVRRTGCSGWAYTLNLAEDVGADDTVFEDRGVKVVVDARALDKIDGMRMDFVTEGLNRQFVFENPNVEDECGCGESFSVKT